MLIFVKNAFFGSKKGAGCIPGVVFGRPVRFLTWFLAVGLFFEGFWGWAEPGDCSGAPRSHAAALD